MLTNSLLGIVLENWIQCVSIFRVKQKKVRSYVGSNHQNRVEVKLL